MPARADAIQYTAQLWVPGLGNDYYHEPVGLPGLTSGGRVVPLVNLYSVTPAEATSTTYNGENPTYLLQSEFPISLTVSLPLDLARSSGVWGVEFQGTLDANYAYTPYGHRLGGTIAGNFTSASSFGGQSFSADAIPADLRALIDHPERLHITGSSNGSVLSSIEVDLTIDPPTPIPEPASLAILMLGVAGLIARRHSSS
ncbi:MAG: hypothetical protein JWN86_3901 [Planctomycetota bacterium]|nr:hypothetical protein [Planctomycetota bacterium]